MVVAEALARRVRRMAPHCRKAPRQTLQKHWSAIYSAVCEATRAAISFCTPSHC